MDHSTNYPSPSTGTDYWMLNHADPSLYWSLYNFDYDMAGGYWGAKKGNETLHALYAYDNSNEFDNNTVAVDNLSGTTESNISVTASVYTINSDGSTTEMNTQTASGITLPPQGVQNQVITETPGVTIPAATVPPALATTYFVELTLSHDGAPVDHNVYWVSTQQDTSASGSPAPTFSSPQAYANLTQLNSLAAPTLSAVAASAPQAGPDGDDTVANLTVTNTGNTVAFFLRADLRSGSAGGTELGGDSYTSGVANSGDNEVKPVEYTDNDITLFPGETQTITASFKSSSLGGSTPVFSLFGYNVPQIVVLDPAGSAADAAQQAAASQAGSVGLGDGAVPTTADPPAHQENTAADMAALKRNVKVVTTIKKHFAAKKAVVKTGAKWLRGHVVRVKVTCTGSGSCAGRLSVMARVRIHGRVRTEAIAGHAFSVTSGRSKTLRFVIGHKVVARLKPHSTLVVRTTGQR
jgi:exo-1,4-beta-D-glucosaminidase